MVRLINYLSSLVPFEDEAVRVHRLEYEKCSVNPSCCLS